MAPILLSVRQGSGPATGTTFRPAGAVSANARNDRGDRISFARQAGTDVASRQLLRGDLSSRTAGPLAAYNRRTRGAVHGADDPGGSMPVTRLLSIVIAAVLVAGLGAATVPGAARRALDTL